MTRRRSARPATGWLGVELRDAQREQAEREPVPPVRAQFQRAQAEFAAGQDALASGQLAVAYNHFVVARGFAVGDELLLADIVAAQGRVRLVGENFGAAGDAFREALRYNPAHVEARLGLAELAVAMRRPARAVEPLYEALALVPEPARRATIHLRLADVRRQQGRPDLAQPHLKAALLLSREQDEPVEPATSVVWRFIRTLEPWRWALAAVAAVVVAGILRMRGWETIQSVAVALVVFLLASVLLLVWAWYRTTPGVPRLQD
ncbi:MAG TPA: tetratricopeptide repeat protein [Ardenticatenaceae bacterium]|nr:tetratricopeptide repeat protein [Ardenticatenaceae bacterium]